MGESSINKENILMAFLYINSYIYIRPKKNGNEETMYNPETRPEAFGKVYNLWLKICQCLKIRLINVFHI